MQELMFILYIANQTKSKTFYQEVLQIEPSLDVPGMTEFKLENNAEAKKFRVISEKTFTIK